MNYEELEQELMRIRKELEDIGVSTEVDEITIQLLHTYLGSATINLTGILSYLEYKIKELKGGAK